MFAIDSPTIINWIVAGLIGLVFGTLSAFFTYRLERRRDDLKWQREPEKLRMEFALQAQQRQNEHEQERKEERSDRIQAELTQGLDDPGKAIRSLSSLRILANDSFRSALTNIDPLNSLVESFKSRRRLLFRLALFAGLVLGVTTTVIVYGFLTG